MYRHGRFHEDVPRGINMAKGLRPWSCSCGLDNIWLCRQNCTRCGRDQPHRIAVDAKHIAEKARREKQKHEGEGDRDRRAAASSSARGRSRDRKSRGDSRGRSQSRGQGGKASYAEVAKRNESADLRKQLASERKAKEELARKLAAATAKADAESRGGGGEAAPEDAGEDDGEDDAAKELRQQHLDAAIDALAQVVEPEDPKLVSLKSEREALVRARREGKPLKAQLLALDRRLDKKKAALRKVETRASEAWGRVEEARKEAEELDREHGELQQCVDDLEGEKRDILRKELEAGSTPEDGIRADNAHFEGTVDAIRSRLEAPGVDTVLAQAIGTNLKQLRNLCAQLLALCAATAGQLKRQQRQQQQQPPSPPPAQAQGQPTPPPPQQQQQSSR